MENNHLSNKNDGDTKDWFLQQFVILANTVSGTFRVTLICHGFLVSGHLIGGKQYFEALGRDMSAALTDTGKLDSAFWEVGEKIYGESDDPNHKRDPSYIHLQDARFYQTNGMPIPTNEGMLWRGKISAIAGFSFGLLDAKVS